jgi:hypothetical protein
MSTLTINPNPLTLVAGQTKSVTLSYTVQSEQNYYVQSSSSSTDITANPSFFPLTYVGGGGTSNRNINISASQSAMPGNYTITFNAYTLENGLQATTTLNITVESPPCYLEGTLIATNKGEVKVENLQIGDMIETYNGNDVIYKPVKWIGYVTMCVEPNSKNNPYRIIKHALGENVPSQDLLVSPAHNIYIDNVLVCAQFLDNGISIYQDSSFSKITYYHIELDKHSIIKANNCLAESYLDCENRFIFDNGYISDVKKSWEKDCYCYSMSSYKESESIRNKIMNNGYIYTIISTKRNLQINK